MDKTDELEKDASPSVTPVIGGLAPVSTQVVPTTVRPALPAYPMPGLDGQGGPLYTSIPMDTPEGRKQVFRCLITEDYKGREMRGDAFEIEHVVIHPWQKVDEETGEVRLAMRTVMVNAEGDRVAVVSDGIIKALDMAASPSMFGPPPWKPPLRVKIIPLDTAKGRKFTTLELV